MLKKISLILLMLTVTVCFASCDGKDGNTSGSAESNGVISDTSRDHTSGTVSRLPNTSREESDEASRDLGDDLSDMLSDAESIVSDVMSDAQSVVSDIVDGQ